MRSRTCLPLLLLSLITPAAAAAVNAIERDGQLLLLEIHPHLDEAQQLAVRAWIETAASTLTLVYGRWPRDRWRVEVAPVSRASSSPVPWGQVLRGDIDTVSFYIDSTASESRLVADWTAYHEFSHLLLPYRGWGDQWFSEGLAS